MPFPLPDWMPGWLFLVIAVPALLWVLAFLMVPFSVFGVKARLEAMEGELAAIQEELRVMQLRASGALPAALRPLDPPEDVPDFGLLKRRSAPAAAEEPRPSRPPIPEPHPPRGAAVPSERIVPPHRDPPPPPKPRRIEPRLD
jgi:hypothetical protein